MKSAISNYYFFEALVDFTVLMGLWSNFKSWYNDLLYLFSTYSLDSLTDTLSHHMEKQLKCPSTDKWIKKLWYIYTMQYYSVIKKGLI